MEDGVRRSSERVGQNPSRLLGRETHTSSDSKIWFIHGREREGEWEERREILTMRGCLGRKRVKEQGLEIYRAKRGKAVQHSHSLDPPLAVTPPAISPSSHE